MHYLKGKIKRPFIDSNLLHRSAQHVLLYMSYSIFLKELEVKKQQKQLPLPHFFHIYLKIENNGKLQNKTKLQW
jgi:hypothetical protein